MKEDATSMTEPESTGIYCTIQDKYMESQPARKSIYKMFLLLLLLLLLAPPREQSLDPKRRVRNITTTYYAIKSPAAFFIAIF